MVNPAISRASLAALVQTYYLAAEMIEIQAAVTDTDQRATIIMLRAKEAEYRSQLARWDAAVAAFEAMKDADVGVNYTGCEEGDVFGGDQPFLPSDEAVHRAASHPRCRCGPRRRTV